jgi:hypothetical protein
MPEDRSQREDDGGQMTDGGGQKAEAFNDGLLEQSAERGGYITNLYPN